MNDAKVLRDKQVEINDIKERLLKIKRELEEGHFRRHARSLDMVIPRLTGLCNSTMQTASKQEVKESARSLIKQISADIAEDDWTNDQVIWYLSKVIHTASLELDRRLDWQFESASAKEADDKSHQTEKPFT